MLISVVIPTFNRMETLPRAVESVLNQTYQNLELIIVNDGSSDETSNYLDSIKDPRVRHISTANQGVSMARNVGIGLAKGEWIAFLDSDDEWEKAKLAEQLKLSTEYKIIHSDEIWIRNGLRVNQMKKHAKSGGWIFQKCLPLCCISPSAVMIHQDVFQAVGLFDPAMTVCEDYDLWLRIAKSYEIGFVAKPLIKKYGGHADQLSRKYKAMDHYRVKAILKVLKDLSGENLDTAKNTLAVKCQILLTGYEKHGHEKLASEIREIQRSFLSI